MFIVRVLLLPISFLYGVITKLRNILFNAGVFRSKEFKTYSISVGNITVGGTGKSPHIEYLIRLFRRSKKIATLSRGYKRESKGFVLADSKSTFRDIGDEPMQFNSKFENINVAVDGDRRRGIATLEKDIAPELILLDDCFQHRWVKPTLSIVLLEYSSVGDKQFMLPSGELREWKSGITRADVIVVSKSPHIYSPIEHRRITELIGPKHHQKIFFSYIVYQEIIPFNNTAKTLFAQDGFDIKNLKVNVFAGIANIEPLLDHLQLISKDLILSEFDDHHSFEPADILRVINQFKEIISSDKILITTEKDAMRLKDERLFPLLEEFPVFYLPIEIKFHKTNEDELSFDQTIIDNVQ
jgi:tetraacyldisaccharide 4'-kinase